MLKASSQTARSVTVTPLAVGQRSDEPEDLGRLFAEVLQELPYYNECAKRSELAKYQPDRLREAVYRDEHSVLVARSGADLTGFCFNNSDDGTVWLSWFGVAASYRRRGVGSALLSALGERAAALGAHKIWCDSRTGNEPSASILRRHGFTEICTIPDHWYRQDFILWEKRVG